MPVIFYLGCNAHGKTIKIELIEWQRAALGYTGTKLKIFFYNRKKK